MRIRSKRFFVWQVGPRRATKCHGGIANTKGRHFSCRPCSKQMLQITYLLLHEAELLHTFGGAVHGDVHAVGQTLQGDRGFGVGDGSTAQRNRS